MPLAGIVHPKTGKHVPTDEALRMAESAEFFEQGIPYHYAAVQTMTSERDVAGISATELLGCARKWFLTREYEYYVDPKERWRLYRGTSIHAAIEEQQEGATGYLSERRYSRPVTVDGWETSLSGQFDMLWPDKGIIADHKDKAYYKRTRKDRNGRQVQSRPDPRHILQLSIYGWILEGSEEYKYPAPKIGGIYYQDGTGPVLRTFKLTPPKDIEPFIIALFREFNVPEGTYPTVLQDEEDVRLMCGRCEVREVCARLASEGR